jgi:hypothetical protein
MVDLYNNSPHLSNVVAFTSPALSSMLLRRDIFRNHHQDDRSVTPFLLVYPVTRRTQQPSKYVVVTAPNTPSSPKRSIWNIADLTTRPRTKSSSQQRLQQQRILRRIVRNRRKRSGWPASVVRNASATVWSASNNSISRLCSLSSSLVLPSAVSLWDSGWGSSKAMALWIPHTLDMSVVHATAQSVRKTTEETVERIHTVAYTSAVNFWYMIPSALCFVPLYTWAFWQTTPVTPTVWKLVNMDFVWRTAPCAQWAMSIVTAFLASNASYFVASAYLLHKSGIFRTQHGAPVTTRVVSTGSVTASDYFDQRTTSNKIPASLGWWILSAGCMSTLFHTVQAIGDYSIAEALCYLDHGVAGTAVLYYWFSCGRPSIRTIVCGVAGVMALAFPAASVCPPAYTLLHSLWHALSALAAVLWAYDSNAHRSSVVAETIILSSSLSEMK